jgi:hypothetical protein
MNNYKTIYKKKPINNEINKQLFSYDVSYNGAKYFFFDTYKNIYKEIKENECNYYEDNTFADKIKLFIDIDENKQFDNELEKDKYAKIIVNQVIQQVNNKLNIDKPKIIILISENLIKLSLHVIYIDITFKNIYDMKYFMNDINIIDKSVYKIGCFRMLWNSKIGKNNKLIYFDSYNYYYKNDYELFYDSCICNSTKEPIEILFKEPIKKIISNTQKYTTQKDYLYRNIDYNVLKQALEKVDMNEYSKWLNVAFCMKDLYLQSSKEHQVNIYNLFNFYSKKSDNYNKINNYNIFMSLQPRLNINNLFEMANIDFYFLPFYNYKEIIFNKDNHENIIIKNEQYIDVNVNEFINYKYIFLKSPTGTGKTTFLKKLIKKLKIKNIISITSRVNLAGEHMKQLDLKFYNNLNYIDFSNCNKLVIQLESLCKCNYKLFKNGIVILDEINSLLSHMRSPTMDKRRRAVYSYLLEIITNAKYVISMDADLADWNIKFLQEIQHNDYIIYYNNVQNKKNINASFYDCPNMIIDKMQLDILNKEYFISCFDSLKKMNEIINYLLKFGNKKDFLIYSSEVNYGGLINTDEWDNKFVCFTPSILYGLDYNNLSKNIYCFVYKTHLNPLQIYQMISRGRQQNFVHIYCKNKLFHLKYKTVDDVKDETDLFENNLNHFTSNNQDIDDKPYRIMFYNFKFMDAVLKTNIRAYLIDILECNGYNILYNIEKKKLLLDTKIDKVIIKDRIVNLLQLDKVDLNEFQLKLVNNDKFLEKHFNLRIFFNTDIDDKITESIYNNLFIETVKNKFMKIKICKELLNILEIYNIDNLNKDISKNFNKVLNDKYLVDNINIIKKTFDIRTNKYNNFTYYNIYLLLITILKHLFDEDIFCCKYCIINKKQYYYYIINNHQLNKHIDIINKIYLIDFID